MQIPWIFVSMENARYNTWTLHKSKSNLKHFYTATSSNETAVKELPLLIYWNYSFRNTDILPHLSYRKLKANRNSGFLLISLCFIFPWLESWFVLLNFPLQLTFYRKIVSPPFFFPLPLQKTQRCNLSIRSCNFLNKCPCYIIF